MKRIVFLAAISVIIFACNRQKTFTVEGTVEGADSKVLYLESVGLNKIVLLDSVSLDDTGNFRFKSASPAYPDFYRLRIGRSFLNFSVDSTEKIAVHVPSSNLSAGYTVSGSPQSEKIRQLSGYGQSLKRKLDLYNKELKDNRDVTSYKEKVRNAVKGYKQKVLPVIYGDPKSAAAYFGLFQRVNDMPVFDPYDREDCKAFSAVATSYHIYYPEYVRSKHLYNLTLQAIKVNRGGKDTDMTDKIKELNYIEIELPDVYGNLRKLSSLQGNVVILDFTAYQAEYSPGYTMSMAELYTKYHDRGLEIFQVSLDPDENSWKVSASNLPWVCVRDVESIYSRYAALYNVKELPTYFILNRNGDIVKRNADVADLEKEIRSLL